MDQEKRWTADPSELFMMLPTGFLRIAENGVLNVLR